MKPSYEIVQIGTGVILNTNLPLTNKTQPSHAERHTSLHDLFVRLNNELAESFPGETVVISASQKPQIERCFDNLFEVAKDL